MSSIDEKTVPAGVDEKIVGRTSSDGDVEAAVLFDHRLVYDEKALMEDMYAMENDDIILLKKMKLVNDAIDEIGFTWYHAKLFLLSGMGYATDTQLTYLELNVRKFINWQFGYLFPVSAETYALGMCLGAVFWGLLGDLIGRRLAFNLSLLLLGAFTIATGAMGTFTTYNLFVILVSFAAGGNLVLDTCVFLEFLPHKDQWLMTFYALFWGVGQVVAVAVSYAFLPNYSCPGPDNCPLELNHGWRYVYYTNGGIVFALAILRLTVIRLQETPKFLVANKRDEECVNNLHELARKYGRTCSLTLEDLEACGTITSNDDYRKHLNVKGTLTLIRDHMKVLFSSRKAIRLSTLLFFLWFCLGIAYPLYSLFLPMYLESRGAKISADTTEGVYRDNLITNACSVGGPIIAGLLLYFFPIIGRRGVLCIGGLLTMAFLFGYTQVMNRAQMVAMGSCVFVCLYIYYGVIYAYTPEVLPASARATGNAMCLLCTRIATAIVPVIAYFANTLTLVPIWICGALMGVIGLVAIFLPFEPSKQRTV